MGSLVESAIMFASTISSESSVARSSKALKAVITRKENKTHESLEQNATFVPFELSIREIIRQEITHTLNASAANNRSRNRQKVSLFGSPSRENESENKKQRPRGQNKFAALALKTATTSEKVAGRI